MLLHFGCFTLCPPGPLSGVSIFSDLSYRYRIIVYLYRYQNPEIVPVRYYRIVIEP